MALTKVVKPVADYHTWVSSGVSNGDILDLHTSHGGRNPRSVTIDSFGGPTTIRFNVSKKIYADYKAIDAYVASYKQKPVLVDEIEEVKDDIIIEENISRTWTSRNSIIINDIKIISKSTGMVITTTA